MGCKTRVEIFVMKVPLPLPVVYYVRPDLLLLAVGALGLILSSKQGTFRISDVWTKLEPFHGVLPAHLCGKEFAIFHWLSMWISPFTGS